MVPALATYEAAPRRLVTTFWRIAGPSQRPMTCALFRTALGLELRAGYDLEGVVVRRAHVVTEQTALIVAAQWKEAALAAGNFIDLDAPA